MATDGPTPKPCDRKIFKKGTPIVLIEGASNAVENWVKAVAKRSRVPVDWHYSGGVAQVLYLGNSADRTRVEEAITALEGTLKGSILQRLEQGDKGRYRAI
jgi:hypothetical protein